MSTDDIVMKLECALEARVHAKYIERQHRSLVVITVVAISLILVMIIGIIGYMTLFELSWIDATYNAILILTAIDENAPALTTAQKAFVSLYAFFSVILLLSLINAGMQRIIDIYTYAD